MPKWQKILLKEKETVVEEKTSLEIFVSTLPFLMALLKAERYDTLLKL